MAVEDRLKLFVTQQARPLVVLFAVAGLFCLLGAGYVFFTPTTQTVSEEVNVQTIESSVGTSAVVTGNSTLYEQGETLENRSAYFVPVTPNLSFHAETDVPPGQDVTVSQRLTMNVVGVRGDQPFYQSEEVLLDERRSVSDGSVAATRSINVSAMRKDIQTKRAETDGVGRFRVSLELNVTYQTDSYEGSLSTSAPFVISGQAYYLDGAVADSQTHSETVQREVQRPSDPAEYGGLALVGLVLFGLCGVIVRTEAVSDPEELRTRISHSRHDEWISRGEFPTESEKQYISILTLADLVDVAIDTNRRVIYDPDIEVYAVIDGNEIYYYSLGDLHAHAWLNL
ncbi:hypothetical protein GJR96_07225 [Haloferax sp. MBLA0076]|uniref:DUF5305 domain-containing protein n=1 Tax=Haloferax litoreum TaxID=2666140 RepID=A0A6A8GFU4_9EURY|nr:MULTISPECIES: DUF5305 domain-containing protein [Haloferax]KAB1193247.1 hypothetical protein Hfx1148_07220 [Haloferax sp. CBA1148]MRX21746.1 hypothetical protein [Haloferax litoreum]